MTKHCRLNGFDKKSIFFLPFRNLDVWDHIVGTANSSWEVCPFVRSSSSFTFNGFFPLDLPAS